MRKAVNVDGNITEIAPAGEDVEGISRNISNVIVKNMGTQVVYLQWTNESDALTTGNGFPLASGDAVGISRSWGGAPITGITAGTTEAVRVSGD